MIRCSQLQVVKNQGHELAITLLVDGIPLLKLT